LRKKGLGGSAGRKVVFQSGKLVGATLACEKIVSGAGQAQTRQEGQKERQTP